MADHDPRRPRAFGPGPSRNAAPPGATVGKQTLVSQVAGVPGAAPGRPAGPRGSGPRTAEDERRSIELFGGARPRAAGAEEARPRSAVSPALERQLLEYLLHGVAPATQFENLLFLGLGPHDAYELHARLSADPPPPADRLATAFHGRLAASDRQSILARLAELNLSLSGDRMWSELAPGEQTQAIQLVSRVDAPDGVFLRGRPAGPKDGAWLPFDTLISATRKTERGWYWVTSLGDDAKGKAPAGVSGFVESYHVASAMPEPSAHLALVQPGDLLKDLAAAHYRHGFAWGHDARVYVQAIYHANKDRDAVYRAHAELGIDRSPLSTTSLREALALWRTARVVAGQALWMPSELFVARLKLAGVIHHASMSKALWDASAGAAAHLLDGAQYLGGFAVGLLEGAWGALEDLLAGAADLGRALWAVIEGFFTNFAELRELGGKLVDAWAQRRELATAIATDFMKKWESKDDWQRGSFQGEVVGYLTMLMFLVYATAGAGAAIAGSGRLGSFIKLVRLADAAGSVGTYARKLRAAIKLPRQVEGDLAEAIGKKVAPTATSPDTASAPDAPGPHAPDAAATPAVRNHGDPYGDPRVDPDRPHRHLEKHELAPTSQLSFATTWKQAAKKLETEHGIAIGRKLHTATEGHDLIARLARGDASALKQLGLGDVPHKLDTTGREWALVETRDGFAIVAGRYGEAELPAGARALAHSHPGPTPAHPLQTGEHPTIDLPVPAGGGKTFAEILEDFTTAKKAGITPSARDIHAISHGGAHVIYTRFVHRGDGKIGNPSPGDAAARVSLHLAGAQVVRFNKRTQEYWYKVDLHVKDSNGRSLWHGDFYAYWTPNDHKLTSVQVVRPAQLDRAPAGGWLQPRAELQDER